MECFLKHFHSRLFEPPSHDKFSRAKQSGINVSRGTAIRRNQKPNIYPTSFTQSCFRLLTTRSDPRRRTMSKNTSTRSQARPDRNSNEPLDDILSSEKHKRSLLLTRSRILRPDWITEKLKPLPTEISCCWAESAWPAFFAKEHSDSPPPSTCSALLYSSALHHPPAHSYPPAWE